MNICPQKSVFLHVNKHKHHGKSFSDRSRRRSNSSHKKNGEESGRVYGHNGGKQNKI